MKYLLFLFIVLHGLSIHAQTPCANPIIATATGFDGEEYLAGYSVEFEIISQTNENGYWNFGDGTGIHTIYSWAWENDNFNITHSFAAAGTYDISFTYGDDICTASLSINVLEAPILTPIIPDYFEANPKWCVSQNWALSQGGCIHYVDQVHYINGDTTFNGVNYKKLYTRGIDYGCGSSTGFYNYIEDYIRQDEEIIYRYYPSEDAEHIMYDFSLSVGDTIPYGGTQVTDEVFPQWPDGSVGLEGMTYIVVEIDSVYLVNEYYKKIIFEAFWNGLSISPITYNAEYDSFIEGIGHQYGFIWPYSYLAEWEDRGLHVFNRSDTLYYEFEENGGTFVCDFNISINEYKLQNLNIQLSPNPVNNKLKIKIPEGLQIEIINIYSINGKKLQSKIIDISNVLIIDVDELQSGMYLLEVISTNGFRDVKRFVVE